MHLREEHCHFLLTPVTDSSEDVWGNNYQLPAAFPLSEHFNYLVPPGVDFLAYMDVSNKASKYVHFEMRFMT